MDTMGWLTAAIVVATFVVPLAALRVQTKLESNRRFLERKEWDGWMDLSAIPNAYAHKCVTVGFVVSETQDAKILVPTIGDVDHPDNSHTYGGMMIPRRAIISERILR